MAIEEDESLMKEYLAVYTSYKYYGKGILERRIDDASRKGDRNFLEENCDKLKSNYKFLAKNDEEAAKEIRKHKRELERKVKGVVKVYVDYASDENIKERLGIKE